MEKTYKRVPFDIELAKKIVSGEVEGRIVTNNGREVTILCFNRKSVSSAPIVALVHYNSYDDHVHTYSQTGFISDIEERSCDIHIELPEEAPKQKLGNIIGDALKKSGELIIKIATLEEQMRREAPKFKPFDKVLVRDKNGYWIPRLYEIYSGGTEKHYCQDGQGYTQCIPYEGNEHLVGTITPDKQKKEIV